MRRRVIELAEGRVVRDEQAGGYAGRSRSPREEFAVRDARGDIE